MPFKLCTSNRLELLADQLAETFRQPSGSALEPEIVVVQSHGMARWLSIQLAHKLGVCANVRFPFPNTFVQEVTRNVLPVQDLPQQAEDNVDRTPDPYAPHILTWRVMRILPLCLHKREFSVLRTYLEEPGSQVKRLQLSSRIADLFDQYLLFRPEMMLKWQAGEGNGWQAQLWREISREHPGRHRAALRQALMKKLSEPDFKPDLPPRITAFGISALPEFHVQVFDAISRFSQVMLFLMNPCQEYWGDIVSNSEIKRAMARKGQRKTIELFNLEKGNALLASMGKLGRDFFDLVEQFDYEQIEAFEDPGEATLLACLQSDLLHLRDRGLTGENKKSVAAEDSSIQFHSCHSVRREVEVLQDYLLDLFQTRPDLEPGDILVMAPDIEPYAPFIQAVFDLPHDDRRRIPFSIADRTYGRESEVISAFFALLNLHDSRFEATRVLSLLEAPPVQKNFGLSSEDLEWIHAWVRETCIRWGQNAQDRRRFGLPEVAQNTWQAGLERLLLGYALPGHDEPQLFADTIVPYDHVEGGQAAALGNLAEFLQRLFAAVDALGGKRTLVQWRQVLTGLLEAFFAVRDETVADLQTIRRVLMSLEEMEAVSGFDEKVELRVIQHFLKPRLQKEGHGFGFLTGGVTFCSMLPMRSIPVRVLCLMGMSGDGYPRRSKHLGFDLMAQKPRKGDRSRRQDDRYLFLEALLSARERLYFSYVGQSIKDNTRVPPSVLISELRDTLAANFEMKGEDILEKLTFVHRLQAFSPAYFDGCDKLFSYSQDNLAAARSLVSSEPLPPALFMPQPLPEPEPAFKTVSLADLYRFFRNPANFLLNRRLGMVLREGSEGIEETEAFALQGLDRYEVARHLVERYVTRTDERALRDFRKAKLATGELPHAAVGACEYDRLQARARHFVELTDRFVAGEALPALDFELELAGCLLRGSVEGIFPAGAVIYRFARVRAKDYLRAWLHHLVLNRVRPENYPTQTLLVGVETAREGNWCGWRFQPVANSQEVLTSLVELYWQGLRQPLRFFPDSALAYVDKLLNSKKTPDEAVKKAQETWDGGTGDGGERIRGEKDDPYLDLCFGREDAPLNAEFQHLARAIFEPIVNHREVIS